MSAAWGSLRACVWRGDAWVGLSRAGWQSRFCLVVERVRLCNRAFPTGSLLISACNGSQTNSRRRSRSGSSLGVTKSDMDFLKKLEEFMLSTGLPLDKVPSTRELSGKGRQDLANAVKRRGYKAVAQLLTDRKVLCGTEVDKIKNDTISGSVLSAASSNGTLQLPDDQVEPGDAELDFCKNDQPFTEDPSSRTVEERVGPSSSKESFFMANVQKFPHGINGQAMQSIPIASVNSPFQEEAMEFIRSGRFSETEADSNEDEEENRDDIRKENFFNDSFVNNVSSKTDQHLSSHFGTAESIAARKVAQLREHSGESFPIHEDFSCTNSIRGQELQSISKVDKDSSLDFQRQIQVELDMIKMSLLSREMELAKMSRELEEAKAQLALFHAKATAELTQTKQSLLEKDLSLQVAQQALAHLKQVLVEWWGEGNKVELAGSFNGWQYNIAMDPDPSSEIANLDGLRGPMMWGTILWLYPGFYEIKFIVDGNWTIDQRREIVMGNMGHNNILQVDN